MDFNHSAGLTPVLIHKEKLCIASYYRQISTNNSHKILLGRPNQTGYNLFNLKGNLVYHKLGLSDP